MFYISELTRVMGLFFFFFFNYQKLGTARCFLNFIMGMEEKNQNVSVFNAKMIDPVYDTNGIVRLTILHAYTPLPKLLLIDT